MLLAENVVPKAALALASLALIPTWREPSAEADNVPLAVDVEVICAGAFVPLKFACVLPISILASNSRLSGIQRLPLEQTLWVLFDSVPSMVSSEANAGCCSSKTNKGGHNSGGNQSRLLTHSNSLFLVSCNRVNA